MFLRWQSLDLLVTFQTTNWQIVLRAGVGFVISTSLNGALCTWLWQPENKQQTVS